MTAPIDRREEVAQFVAMTTTNGSLLSSVFFACTAGIVALGCSSEVESPYLGVKGTYIDMYIWENGEVTIPGGPNEMTVAALVMQSESTWTTYEGTLNADGTFQIPDVPEGSYYLKLRRLDRDWSKFYWTDERIINLGLTYGSRPDTKEIMNDATTIAFNLGGMSSWQDTDALELYSLGADALGFLSYFDLMAGSTSLNDAVPAKALIENLIEGSKGDVVYITQLPTRDLGGAPYQSVGKVFKPAPFTLIDGQSTTLDGSFDDVPQKTLAIDVKRSRFAALATEVHPAAKLVSAGFGAFAEPGGQGRITNSASPTLISCYGGEGDIADLAGELSYGNPFPAGWALVASAGATFKVSAMLPGADSPTTLYGIVDCRAEVSGAGPVSFSPGVHPVKNVRVNGKSTEVQLTGAGLTPTVSWTAPDGDGVYSYLVRVGKLDPMSSTNYVASIATSETSVVIPEGVLENGGFYYFRIGTYPGMLDMSNRPNAADYACYADAITHVVEP